MNITSHRRRVIYQAAPLEGFDAVIPRIGASKTFYGTAVVRQFEMMGCSRPTSRKPLRARAISCAAAAC